MKKVLYLLAILFVAANISAIPIDTGFITWEQPDGSTFTARMWGDEFIWRMEDPGGYRMIQGSNGWFYYAQLDVNGEYTPTVIAVDESVTPPAVSYQLERTQARMDEIQAEIDAFAAEQAAKLNALQNGTPMFPTTGTQGLAVVLVDFADNLNNDYAKEKFDSLFFSTGYWVDEDQDEPDIHPDGHLLFGSFRDYWLDQSTNQLDIVGKDGTRSIINPEDQNNPGKALWVQMPHGKDYYQADSNGYTTRTIKDTFKVYAEDQLGIDLDVYSSICFVYAGKRGKVGEALWPSMANGMFCVSESNELTTSYARPTFIHIGVAIHEFGHVLGAADEYNTGDIQSVDEPKKWALMATGAENGPRGFGECPAPLSPGYKFIFDWAAPITLELPQVDLHIDYNDTNFYKVKPFNTSEYFIIERRTKDGFDKHTPIYEDITPPGIMVWHFAPEELDLLEGDFVRLKWAKSSPPVEITDYRFPENGLFQDVSDITSPHIRLRNGSFSNINMEITWNARQPEESSYASLDISSNVLNISSNRSL